MKTHYDILGISQDSSQEEIKKAYRVLSKKFHPDLNNGDDYFAGMFRQIKDAYDILSDTQKRSRYDHEIGINNVKREQSSQRQNTEPSSNQDDDISRKKQRIVIITKATDYLEMMSKERVAERLYNQAQSTPRKKYITFPKILFCVILYISIFIGYKKSRTNSEDRIFDNPTSNISAPSYETNSTKRKSQNNPTTSSSKSVELSWHDLVKKGTNPENETEVDLKDYLGHSFKGNYTELSHSECKKLMNNGIYLSEKKNSWVRKMSKEEISRKEKDIELRGKVDNNNIFSYEELYQEPHINIKIPNLNGEDVIINRGRTIASFACILDAKGNLYLEKSNEYSNFSKLEKLLFDCLSDTKHTPGYVKISQEKIPVITKSSVLFKEHYKKQTPSIDDIKVKRGKNGVWEITNENHVRTSLQKIDARKFDNLYSYLEKSINGYLNSINLEKKKITITADIYSRIIECYLNNRNQFNNNDSEYVFEFTL